MLLGRYQARGRISQISIRGEYAFAISDLGGLQVFDIKNPLYPVWVTGVDIGSQARDLYLTHNYAFVASGKNGLIVVDISNPFQIKLVQKMLFPGSVDGLRGSGNMLYLINDLLGVVAVDISAPKNPKRVKTFPAKINDLWVEDEKLFLATRDKGLEVFDMSNVHAPVLIARDPSKNPSSIVRSRGDFVFLYQATLKGKGIRIL